MLTALLEKRRQDILDRWVDAVLDSYPADTAAFLRGQKDRFRNPVGHTLRTAAGKIVDGLVAGDEVDSMVLPLDDIIKIRSIQDYTASQAVSFVYLLKQAVRTSLQEEDLSALTHGDLLALEDRIDRLALTAFDVYMRCRERIYEIKANEVRKRTHLLLERTGYFNETSG